MTVYRKPRPYRKPQRYNGDPVDVAGFGHAATYRCLYTDANSASIVNSLPTNEITARNLICQSSFDGMAEKFQRVQIPFVQLSIHNESVSAKWDAFAEFFANSAMPFFYPTPRNQSHRLLWEDFENKQLINSSVPFVVGLTEHNQSSALPWRPALANQRTVSAFWQKLIARGAVVALPWSPIAARQSDTLINWPVEVDPDGIPITVPILPVYFMIPSLSVVRLPDRTPINVLSVSVSEERGSWAWSFDAPIAFADLVLVDPSGSTEPTEIEISINGYVWTMKVESKSDNRKFGSRTATINGRSLSAELAQPYAPQRTYTQTSAKNASQLADDELAGTGWTLVWAAVDWLLPAGTFSYQDLSPMDVISRLAESIGASVQTDPENKTISVKSNYEDSPWAWGAATPYAILPANIVTGANGSWQGGTNADGIYVYAQNTSFGAKVQIAGSGGTKLLSMVVDPLLISADPVRERGRVEIAKAGRIKIETITIPLFPSPATPGLIPVGALVDIQESVSITWRALVTGVRIDAQRSGKVATVRQTLTLERQYRE